MSESPVSHVPGVRPGNFTGCRDCGWASTERASPGQAAVDLANHLRDHHAPRPKDGTE